MSDPGEAWLAARCPACQKRVIPLPSKLFAALRSEIQCPACGASVTLSLWPRTVHLVLGEAAVLAGSIASFALETPVYLALAAASWFGFGVALPLSQKPRPAGRGRR